MSEKRFIRKGTIISDIQNGTAYLLESASDCNRLLDLLNGQQSTINELQSIINHIKCEENCEDYDYCCETVCSLYNEIKHLKEENEQLRKELKEIKENPINYF